VIHDPADDPAGSAAAAKPAATLATMTAAPQTAQPPDRITAHLSFRIKVVGFLADGADRKRPPQAGQSLCQFFHGWRADRHRVGPVVRDAGTALLSRVLSVAEKWQAGDSTELASLPLRSAVLDALFEDRRHKANGS
jgi:hypothetical protein